MIPEIPEGYCKGTLFGEPIWYIRNGKMEDIILVNPDEFNLLTLREGDYFSTMSLHNCLKEDKNEKLE